MEGAGKAKDGAGWCRNCRPTSLNNAPVGKVRARRWKSAVAHHRTGLRVRNEEYHCPCRCCSRRGVESIALLPDRRDHARDGPTSIAAERITMLRPLSLTPFGLRVLKRGRSMIVENQSLF